MNWRSFTLQNFIGFIICMFFVHGTQFISICLLLNWVSYTICSLAYVLEPLPSFITFLHCFHFGIEPINKQLVPYHLCTNDKKASSIRNCKYSTNTSSFENIQTRNLSHPPCQIIYSPLTNSDHISINLSFYSALRLPLYFIIHHTPF